MRGRRVRTADDEDSGEAQFGEWAHDNGHPRPLSDEPAEVPRHARRARAAHRARAIQQQDAAPYEAAEWRPREEQEEDYGRVHGMQPEPGWGQDWCAAAPRNPHWIELQNQHCRLPTDGRPFLLASQNVRTAMTRPLQLPQAGSRRSSLASTAASSEPSYQQGGSEEVGARRFSVSSSTPSQVPSDLQAHLTGSEAREVSPKPPVTNKASIRQLAMGNGHWLQPDEHALWPWEALQQPTPRGSPWSRAPPPEVPGRPRVPSLPRPPEAPGQPSTASRGRTPEASAPRRPSTTEPTGPPLEAPPRRPSTELH